jgi:hypothetical protein
MFLWLNGLQEYTAILDAIRRQGNRGERSVSAGFQAKGRTLWRGLF